MFVSLKRPSFETFNRLRFLTSTKVNLNNTQSRKCVNCVCATSFLGVFRRCSCCSLTSLLPDSDPPLWFPMSLQLTQLSEHTTTICLKMFVLTKTASQLHRGRSRQWELEQRPNVLPSCVPVIFCHLKECPVETSEWPKMDRERKVTMKES